MLCTVISNPPNGQHHVTIPDHDPLRLGTLNAILKDVAEHLGIARDELLSSLRDD